MRKKAKSPAKKRKAPARTKKRNERDETKLARAKVLKAAKEAGIISNKEAIKIGKWTQAWYHLNALRAAGKLKRSGYNQWMPAKSR